MNSATVLDVEKVSYSYGSRAPVLHEVTFFVNAGEIVGLVGPNGSGKSTLIKLVFNLLQLKEGSIRINGNSHQAKAARVQAQYLASNDHIPEFLRASDYLQLAADLYHENLDASEAESFFESYGMPNRLHDLMEDYSHGMRKKVQLISAFLMRRPLTVIDETLNGIDIEARRCQVVEAMGGCPRRSRSKDSRGVRKPSVARGRSLSSSAIAVR